MKYVNLVVDNKTRATDRMYTYGCHQDDIRVGQKVRVCFGRGKRLKDAYVFGVSDRPEEEFKNLRYVEEVDEDISLNREMMEVISWMRDRYLCLYMDGIRAFTSATGSHKRGALTKAMEGVEEEAQNIEALTESQKKAVDAVNSSIEKRDKKRFLLWGVTGSGKTEVYMQAIEHCIKVGRRAVMLVPEISLTGQITARFSARFGKERIAVLHSGLTPAQRSEEWQKIRKGRVDIVIGARSAVFAPIENAGVIIVDEEHESTYKSDMAPKYETVEVAIKRATLMDSTLVLGSATPSVSTFYRSTAGIYERLELKERYNKVSLPAVEVVDMKEEMKTGNTSPISRRLREVAERDLARGKQAIFFLNRRGYNTCLICDECGHVTECPDCGITLTYHKSSDSLVCHYCEKKLPVPDVCPKCGSGRMMRVGTGTEKVEEEVERLFPDYKVARLDLDTAKGKPAKIIKDFSGGKTRILTGTQIIAKGLDHPNVSLTGIISADSALHIPDYRSPERTFQLITQAAGRAGRGSERGLVIIQTSDTDNYAVKAAARQDYLEFYRQEIKFREIMGYPPFGDLIQVILSSLKENIVEDGAQAWKSGLAALLGSKEEHKIYGPKVMTGLTAKEGHRRYILIKSPEGKRGVYMGAIKALAEEKTGRKSPGYTVSVDVNPYRL